MTQRNITFIGTGYVGLVSGTCFAELGFNVTCMDVDAGKIEALKERGEIPIYEPGLDELVAKNVAAGRLKFTTDLSECVPNSDAVFIGVGTPQGDDGRANLKYVWSAAENVAKHLNGYTVVVTKSTVPVGTNRKVKEIIAKTNPVADFDVASNPEFLREGAAIEDFLINPDRVVVGSENEKAKQLMTELYKPLTDKGFPLLHTGLEGAEIIKYASNAFLATKITFINEIAALCDAVGANVEDVSKGMGMDSRIGPKFLQPGPGYGGSCFPKDTNALAAIGADHGAPQTIVEQTIVANQQIKERMAAKIIAAMGGDVKAKKIAILGLAFKAETDDMRDGSSITIIPKLAAAGANVVAYDPEAMENAKKVIPNLNCAASIGETVEATDCVVVLTEWNQFKTMDLASIKAAMHGNTFVDLRNLFKAEDMRELGFTYSSIGR